TPHVFVNGIAIPGTQVEQAWNGMTNLGSMANAVIHLLDAGSRLSLVADGGIWDPYAAAPANPIQRLYNSRELEQKLSTLLKQAFNEELTVHRYSGTQISLRMGKVSAEEVPPPATREYLEEINALPHWGEQGDGMKSFLGIALALFTADYPIILIDEPEAFLHPPQAYLLGRVLAQLG